MESKAQRLLNKVKEQLVEFNIPHAIQYEANVVAFLNQCPDDRILKDATVSWDGEIDFDFKWDTERFDCRFSIGLTDTGWHLWAGVNNHSKDDECFQHGIVGDEGLRQNEMNKEPLRAESLCLPCAGVPV